MPYLDDQYKETAADKAFRATDLRQRLKYIDSRRGEAQYKKIGNIGPYEVHHVPSEYIGSQGDIFRTHHIMVTHRNKPIGAVNFSEEPAYATKTFELPAHIVAQGPIFVPRHSGSRSNIHALPSRVYQMVAKHFNMPIVSGFTQSRGGQSVWANLAKIGKVSAINTHTGEKISHYIPDNPEHVSAAYPQTDRGQQSGHYWFMMHHPENKS